jgi:hypothetical protein
VNQVPDLATLPGLSRAELEERFRALFQCSPPPSTHRALLIRAVAHRLQEQAQGGPHRALHRRLNRLATQFAAGGTPARPARNQLKPGTRLLREWQGHTHRVTVTEDGYVYRGTRYRSLSAIARAITGTRWSGPAFFGMAG